MSNSYFTKVIRKLVCESKLDYYSLGLEIGASEKSIYRWMNGTQIISGDRLLKLIALVGVDKFNQILEDI